MTQVTIQTQPSYPVIIERGLLQNIGERLKPFIKGKALIITDERVDSFYGDLVNDQLMAMELEGELLMIGQGEESKSLEVYGEILEYMAMRNYHRNDTILALGGGVVGDLSGFVAASFQRGMDYIQIPTSLLAAVDSSVGGKTALNLDQGKNLVGAFKQPLAVFCDPDSFQTMEDHRFSDGVAEAIKYGILGDREFFELFKNPLLKEDDRLEKVVEFSVKFKAETVARDEFEKGERKFLNLGHTIGHSIEKASHYQVTHGHAVSIGMAMMARACSKKGILSEEDKDEILEVLEKNKLPTKTDYSVEELFHPVFKDKKSDGKNITIVEIVEIGKCRLKEIPIREFKSYLVEGQE